METTLESYLNANSSEERMEIIKETFKKLEKLQKQNAIDLLRDLEIFHISTKDGSIDMYLSYQDINNIENFNNGYDYRIIPFNPRKIQLSSRNNPLVNQSIKGENINLSTTN